MENPSQSTIRTIAQQNGISIARVDAILRLKGLEDQWKKVRLAFELPFSPRSDIVWDEFKSISL